MTSRIQELAAKINMSYDEFIGEMRKRGCSEPTAVKSGAATMNHLMILKITI